jgi:hypothetical protein
LVTGNIAPAIILCDWFFVAVLPETSDKATRPESQEESFKNKTND